MILLCCFAETSTSIDEELVAEAFLRLFVETVGHYTEYIDLEQQNGERVFMVITFLQRSL